LRSFGTETGEDRSGKDKIIGVNVFRLEKEDPIEILEVDNFCSKRIAIIRLKKLKAERNAEEVEKP